MSHLAAFGDSHRHVRVGRVHSGNQEQAHRRLRGRCRQLTFETITDFDAAVGIYRCCRSNGVTPRGTIDCMIVAVALRHEATLLAWDVDILRIAQVTEGVSIRQHNEPAGGQNGWHCHVHLVPRRWRR